MGSPSIPQSSFLSIFETKVFSLVFGDSIKQSKLVLNDNIDKDKFYWVDHFSFEDESKGND